MKYLILLFYLIIILIHFVKSNGNQCIYGYTYYDAWCYKYHSITTTSLSDAQKMCAEDNGDLPVIHDSMTNEFITNFVTDSVWLGLTCTDKKSCSWIDNSPYDYNNFQNGIPQTYIGNSVKLLIHKDQSNFNGIWVSSSVINTNATTLCRIPAKSNLVECPLNYSYISNENNNCYKFVNDLKTFNDATIACRNDGGDLVSIHSLIENHDIFNFIQTKTNRNSAWIGLQYEGSNSMWLDKSTYDFNNYKKGFPNNLFGSGVEILLINDSESEGYWENTLSTNTLPFVCKMTEIEVNKYESTTTTTSLQVTTLSPSNRCPNSPMYENNGYINSPGYPSFYGNNMDCYYYLISNKESYVQFKIIEFDLDTADSLDVYDGNDFNNIIKSLTGADNNNAPGLILTTKNNNFMVLRFRSGGSTRTNFSGFNGYFTTYSQTLSTTTAFVETTSQNECPSKEFTNNSEIIESPGYPKSYGANLLCTYLIKAPMGKLVTVQFEQIKITQDEVSLEVYDGKGMSVNMLKQITKSDNGKIIFEISTSNCMTIVFYTSGSPGAIGDLWSLYYRFV